MKVSKLLVSTAAAVTVFSAVGFAYAQYGDNRNDPQPTMQNQPLRGSSGMDNSTGTSNSGSTGAVGAASTDTSNMGNERLARADRN